MAAKDPRKSLKKRQAKSRSKGLAQAIPSTSESKSLNPTSPMSLNDKPFQWSVQTMDRDYQGNWDWKLEPKELHDLLDLLNQTSKLTWGEVKGLKFNSKRRTRQLHHDQPVSSICHDARQRLADLDLHLEQVYRLRHGNMIRVWGYTIGPVFHILWFDRNHQVCPSEG